MMSAEKHDWLSIIRTLLLVVVVYLSSSIAPLANPQSTDEAQLRTLMTTFFAAYQRKDLDGLMSLWSESSPDVASSKQTLRQIFDATEKIELKTPEVRRVSLVGNRAVVTVTVEGSSVSTSAGTVERMSRTVRFIIVKDMAGWKVWSYLWGKVELASALADAETDDEQKRLLEKEVVTVELVQELVQLGLYELGNDAQALRILGLAQKLAEQVNDRKSIADAFLYSGHIHRRQRKFTEASELYRRSLNVLEVLGEKTDIAFALTLLGLVYEDQADYSTALEYYQRSLKVQREIGSKAGIGYLLRKIGGIYSDKGDYTKALQYHQESLKLTEETGDKRSISSALFYLAHAHFGQGDYAKALEYKRRSLTLSEELGDKQNIAITLNSIGLIYFYQGNYARAFEYYLKSLSLGSQASPLGNIGIIYALQGDYAKALEYHQKSLKLIEDSGNPAAISAALDNIGLIYSLQGDDTKAFEHYQRSLAVSERVGNTPVTANTLNNIGLMYANQNDAEQALKYYQRCLKLREESGDKNGLAVTLASIAQAHMLRKDPSQALAYAERASAISGDIGVPDVYLEARTTAGMAYRMLNQPDRARQALDDAITTIEQLRGQVAGHELDRQRFFENKVTPYHDMVDLLIDQGNPAGAFAYAERAKGRVLLDVLDGGRANITKAMTRDEQQQERKLDSEIVSLNSQILIQSQSPQHDSSRMVDLNAQLQRARLEHEAFQTSLYAAHPELKVQRGKTQSITVEGTSALLTDDKTALLEFMVGREMTYLFVLTKEKKERKPRLKVYPIPVKARELSTQVGSFLKVLSEGTLGFRKQARDLYDMLLEPARKELQGKETVCIVPDGVLWELPFQALEPREGAYLLEDHAIFYAPSLSVLDKMVTLARQKEWSSLQPSLLAFGNPALSRQTIEHAAAIHRNETLAPLPNAEKEVRSVAQLYAAETSRILIGAEAREARVKSEAGKYQILHFATHAMLDDNSPLYSRVLLSQVDNEASEDGLLEAREIMELDLKADMAILSACQTGRGRIGAGEGVIGTAWAFFVAGCPTTVVSQWKVDSTSTTEFMIEFHRQLTRRRSGNGARASRAQALRLAAMSLLKKKKYGHPFYWAAFIVVGNGM
jgi:CHAT domain-containing protein/Tfp pilus assembly protein PilF